MEPLAPESRTRLNRRLDAVRGGNEETLLPQQGNSPAAAVATNARGKAHGRDNRQEVYP